MSGAEDDPVDPHFGVPRLAQVYDALDPDRSDLDAYVDLLVGLGARSVLDIGCGTGSLAIRLADLGLEVTGVDPARAALDVAMSKPGADRVRWIHGDVTVLATMLADEARDREPDVAVMSANVAQVFLTDEAWAATLTGVRDVVRPGGHLVFETRVPEAEAWRQWTPELTRQRVEVPGVGGVRSAVEVVEVSLPLVSFVATITFERDGAVYRSPSTLRFRDRDEIGRSLTEAGFDVVDVRDAPDRPGRELVVIARSTLDPRPAAPPGGQS